MQGGKTTTIFHGVTIRMCRIHNGSKEISNMELTIKLHHKRSNQIQSQRRMTSKVLYSNFLLCNNKPILRPVKPFKYWRPLQVIQRLEAQMGYVTSHISWVWEWRCAYMYIRTLLNTTRLKAVMDMKLSELRS